MLHIPKTAHGAERGVSEWIRQAATAVNSLIGRQDRLESYTVAALPSAEEAGRLIYVTDEAGGAVPAFSDGTDWRRVTDRAVVS